MDAGIFLRKVWFDEHCVEMEVKASDGVSLFSTAVYVTDEILKTLVTDLNQFKAQLHGGIYDLHLGEFGPEYAGGAFHARHGIRAVDCFEMN